MKSIIPAALVMLICFASAAPAADKTLIAEKLLVQWGGPETRVRCSKWVSTKGFKCNGLRCGTTTWKTCAGHATDLLQHKIFAQVYAHDYKGDYAELRRNVLECLDVAWDIRTNSRSVSQFLKKCLTNRKLYGLRYTVQTTRRKEW